MNERIGYKLINLIQVFPYLPTHFVFLLPVHTYSAYEIRSDS